MKNIGDLMKQASQMQAKMEEMQERVAAMEAEGVAGGGMVKVVLNGKGYCKGVAIDRSLFNPDDGEVLEDLVAAAINDAKSKAEAAMQEEMSKLTEGLSLPPGMKLPF
ncbi:MAG: YbaB/EbfC family nucleoid-associated protein [Alphaproteobacteria bacterium]|nr:YbaB/EbfC family nucleoid-associated protein [Alphaproteobacteria bacterium]